MSLDLSGLEAFINKLRAANALLAAAGATPTGNPELATGIQKAQRTLAAITLFNGSPIDQADIGAAIAVFEALRTKGTMSGAAVDDSIAALVDYAVIASSYAEGKPAGLAPVAYAGKIGVLMATPVDTPKE